MLQMMNMGRDEIDGDAKKWTTSTAEYVLLLAVFSEQCFQLACSISGAHWTSRHEIGTIACVKEYPFEICRGMTA